MRLARQPCVKTLARSAWASPEAGNALLRGHGRCRRRCQNGGTEHPLVSGDAARHISLPVAVAPGSIGIGRRRDLDRQRAWRQHRPVGLGAADPGACRAAVAQRTRRHRDDVPRLQCVFLDPRAHQRDDMAVAISRVLALAVPRPGGFGPLTRRDLPARRIRVLGLLWAVART
jgi:hypothetical protein